MYCPNTSSNEWKDLVKEVGENEAWRNFFKYGEIRTSPSIETGVYKSIRTRPTAEIAEGINKDLIRSQQDIKYTNYIQSLTLDAIGEISPNKVIQTSMESAFGKAKSKFEASLRNANDFVNAVKSPEIFNALKQKDGLKLDALIDRFNLQGVRSFEDVLKAINQYQSIIDNFDKYKDFVKAELNHKGIREVEGKIVEVQSQDVTNQEEDNTDEYELAQEEIGERFGKSFNEVNPRDTASLRVKSLVNNIKIPGKFELGIPLYADPSDVFQDLINAGVDMRLSGYTDNFGKYEAFVTSLQKVVEARPYLAEVINKLENFKKAGQWDTINEVLTFASKAFANETLVLYKPRRSGTAVTGITEIKTININRDTVEEQVSKEWYAQQMNSDFFIKTAIGERFPNPDKVAKLKTIIDEGKTGPAADKIKKFQEFFAVMGIKLSDKDMEYIAPRLGGEIKKGRTFDFVFSNKGMLENIYMGYANNLEIPFLSQYGLQNEGKSVGKLARLYYEANPGMINIPSARSADGKQKHLFVQPSFVEIRKRQWELGDTSSLMNSALALPNKEFWSDVKNGNKVFTLQYFNGMREQEAGRDGKVRKNFTSNEQTRAMFMKHQENMNTGTYVIFTLSDKTSSIEVKQSKEFFVDSPKIPVGKGTDFILNEKGDIEYRDDLKEKIYQTFVEPEVSRILASMKHAKDVNLENFETASKLFYFIPEVNSSPLLENFRKDLYTTNMSVEDISKAHAKTVGAVVLDQFIQENEQLIDDYINKGVIRIVDGIYTYPSFKTGFKGIDYLSRFRKTEAKGRNLARLMVMDMQLNYMNAQVKTIQFLRFDPMVAFKMPKDVKTASFDDLKPSDKIKIANTTWDDFSKRAASLIAPGGQGSWSWMLSNGERYFSKDYKAVTAADVSVKVNNVTSDITDAQELTTLQEHIDYLMSEGKISEKVWESIYNKIKKAGPGGFYTLTGEEMKYVFTPLKPVHVNDVNEGDNTGLNRIDYVKSSRYPLIPEHEVGTERDKLRQWMEKNDISSVNFASAKKLGRPGTTVNLFDKNGNFVQPSEEDMNGATQVLSRDGLRTQQEIPHQKDEIATVTQMNRTLFDGLLTATFNMKGLGQLTGGELKEIKERVRSKMFSIKAKELDDKLGNFSLDHRGLYDLLRDVILNDTTGSYGENDLRALQIDPISRQFLMPLELNFKAKKIQGLINSMINKNVMLKMNGSSFVQVSGVGSKFTLGSLSSGVKSSIIWTDKHAATFKGGEAKLNYISEENGVVKPAQVIVSQYLKDKNGKLINLEDFITVDKNGLKILDTSKIDPSLLELVASRIPNQSHVSMLPIEVVGFLPSYMEDTIIVPDGITGQMGSDFDVDKLYAYKSKTEAIKDSEGKIIGYKPTSYTVNSLNDIDNLSEEQLKEFYRDIHWTVLTNPATYKQITKSVDNKEVSKKKERRKELLEKYKVSPDTKVNLPLSFSTSIDRFNDNRSGKDGVSIFANLISAQADFQDKPLKLGNVVEGETVPKPIFIKINGETLAFEYLGQTGTSTSITTKQKKSVGDNLNIPFGESVDNAKNLNLREFNWDKKAMSAVGVLNMLTTSKQVAIPIEFSMDLTSQAYMYKLFNLIEQKQDSFEKFDPNAFRESIVELQNQITSQIDTGAYLKNGKLAADYLLDDKRDKALDPNKLENMWLVGQILKEKDAVFAAKMQETATEERVNLSGIEEAKLYKVAKDFGYKTIDDLLLDYYTTQYDSLELFNRLNGIGTELMTILGSVYTYTKGIGPDVFATKQKLNQLNKLAGSSELLGIENIGGQVFKNEDGIISIDPKGEIGFSLYYSLIKAQSIYQSLFPISTGKHLESLVDSLLRDQGLNKDELGKQRYYNVYNDVFNAIKSYMYTMPDLELFINVKNVRDRLINGETSLGKSIIDLKEIPEFSRNGFLKNVEVIHQSNGNAYTLAFKAPFGTDKDEKSILSGFYELATSENENVREIARELALYPFATGDAGNIGRFIPIDYYIGDEDFKEAISMMNMSYAQHMDFGGMSAIKDQIVQNNPEAYSKKFTFSTSQTSQGVNDNVFKKNFKKFIDNANDLKNVSKFTIKIGDFKIDPKAEGIVDALTIKTLTTEERADAARFGLDFKYPAYIMINDLVVSEFDYGDSSVNYLYKRVSDPFTPEGDATYERINILGYKNIKEYDFNNPSLKSVIKENQVDVSNEEFAPSFVDESVVPVETSTPFEQQGSVKPTIDTSREWRGDLESRPVYTAEGINTMRTSDAKPNEHFGNPFSEAGYAGTIKVASIADAVVAYKEWLLGTKYQDVKPQQRQWILDQINQGKLDDATLLYAGKSERRGKGMHPTALVEVVEKLRGQQQIEVTNNPAEYTNHSGGAIGADSAWDAIGKEFGVVNHNHYYYGNKTPKGNVELTKAEVEEGIVEMRKAAAILDRNPKKTETINLLARNWFQVKNSDQIVAIAPIADSMKSVEGGTGWAVAMAQANNKEIHVFNQKDNTWYTWNGNSFVKSETPTLKKNFAGIGSRELTPAGRKAIKDVYTNTFNPTQSSTIEEQEEDDNESYKTVLYGAHTFILEGSPEEGYDIWYQKEGGKGELVTDQGLINKVETLHLSAEYPENVVTLTDMPNSPKYYVHLAGEIVSLQDSTLGKQIVSNDIVARVNKALAQKLEHDPESTAFVEETVKKQFDEQTGKRINVPEGSNPNNMVIFEDANTKYLMNDGQQEAYNFIKSTVERLLKDRQKIRPEDLENTVSFLDPLTQKFNGIIPKSMWDHMIGLAGRGGVGKTTVIRAIMDGLESGNKYRRVGVMYLTPSHTAATVLQESLGLDSEKANDGTVNTIQSAVRRNIINNNTGNLELMGEESYLAGLKYKPAFSSPDIIIVDESSMVTTEHIKDMIARIKTDLANGHTNKMPIFIFMGDYRQLGPIKEQQNPNVNKGIISSTLLLNKEKTKELTQVMRSNDTNLHEIYDAIGNQIIQNIKLTQQGEKAKQLSFEAYDRLTNKSTENILVVDNVVGVIDDYTEFLKDNNNPYGMFWVHYNKVENPTTIALSDKIRKTYFQKIGKKIDSVAHRQFSDGDYIEFTGSLEIPASDFMYTPTDLEIKKMLDERKIDNVDGEYAIANGVIKPRSRYKVMDIQKSQVPLKDLLPSSVAKFVTSNKKVDVENILLYNRQNKLRGYSKALGVTVNYGRYNGKTKKQEGITLKDKLTGEVLAQFDMFYGDFKTVSEDLKYINDSEGTKMPFVPSYIGSSHTAQGNSIRNVIVGDYNIKQNRANPDINQDDIFSSMYVALTRTSGTLIIIKPQGANISHNQEVFKGAIKDDGKSTSNLVNSVKPATSEPLTPQTSEIVDYAGNEVVDPLDLIMRDSANVAVQTWVDSIFKGETTVSDFKSFMNRIFVNGNEFNKKVITAIAKSGVITPFKVVLDYKLQDAGRYDSFTKTITINPTEAIGDSTDNASIKEKLHQVFMHELMHHLTVDLLNAKPETLSAEQRKWVDSLNNLFNAIQQRMLNDPNHKDALQRAIDQVKNDGYLSASDKSQYYGLTNVHDFVSMLMTDQGFQDFMNNTTYDGEKSIFQKFLDLINDLLKVLGIKVKDDSVLKEGVTNIMGLIQSRNQSDVSSEQRSIATREMKEANINSNFQNVINFLNIKTKC